MTQTFESSLASAPSQATAHSAYRPDIDGLRAVAILLVTVYHVWFNRVSGGVDAFLMISAFFLTGSLIRMWEYSGSVPVRDRLVRTFHRIVPLASLTVAATVIFGFFFLPGSSRESLGFQAWSSLFYFENWTLAFTAVDYYADNATASPFQHFWSLSVQGQVFVIWPLLFFLLAFVLRNISRERRRAAAAYMLGIIFVVSFVYSVATTGSRQEFAYFDTLARLWEFAAGGLLAIALPRITGPRWVFVALGWIGIAGLLSCGALLDVQGGFPGYLALWPVLSVAAVIVSGAHSDVRYTPNRFLASPALLKFGSWSYALYLVHWPLLVFVLDAKNGEDLTFLEGSGVILASIGIAALVTSFVDQRLRGWSWPAKNWRRGVYLVAAFLSLASIAIGTMQVAAAADARRQEAALLTGAPRSELHPGARVLDPDWTRAVPTGIPLIPLPHDLDSEWGALPLSCDDLPNVPASALESCARNAEQASDFTLVIAGNSHPEQWLPVLEEVAKEEGWRLISFLKGGCTLGITEAEAYEDAAFGAECLAWNEAILGYLLETRPDAVLTTSTATVPTNSTLPPDWGEHETVVPGLDIVVQQLNDANIPAVLMRDNPRFTFDAYECAIQEQTLGTCSVQKSQVLANQNPSLALRGPGVSLIDMSDIICPAAVCPVSMGNVALYRDDNHLSLSFTETTQFAFKPRLLQALRLQ